MAAANSEQVTGGAYARWVLGTSLLATFLTVLNSSMVNIALPTLMAEFVIPIDQLTWVVTGYMLPYSILMPMFGQLGDLYGRRKTFIAGIIIFLAGSVLASIAPSFPVLLLARVIQATGASAVLPNGMALVTAVFPPAQRGRVLGIWGAVAALGAVAGPTVGGYLVQYASWRAIFYVNIPLGLIALGMCIFVIREVRGGGQARAFDYGGAVTLAASIFCLMLAITQVERFGLLSLQILGLLAGFIILYRLFLSIEKRAASPMVDFSLFRNRTFVAATAGGFIQMFSIYAVVLPIPIFMQKVQGVGTAETGLYLVAASLSQTVASPIGGWLVDRIQKRIPAVIGMVFCTAAFLSLSRLAVTSSGFSIAFRLVMAGTGIGLMTSALTGGVIEASPAQKVGVSSGLYNMVRFIGSVFSATILGSLLQIRAAAFEGIWNPATSELTQEVFGLINAFPALYLLSAGVTLAGALIVSRIQDLPRNEP